MLFIEGVYQCDYGTNKFNIIHMPSIVTLEMNMFTPFKNIYFIYCI